MLLDKKARRRVEYTPDYIGFDVGGGCEGWGAVWRREGRRWCDMLATKLGWGQAGMGFNWAGGKVTHTVLHRVSRGGEQKV